MTVMASSLRDDDLMLSASQVDPFDKSGLRSTGKQGTLDKSKVKKLTGEGVEHLAIQEESSSLKSLSPLTEKSASRKSNLITNQSPVQPPVE